MSKQLKQLISTRTSSGGSGALESYMVVDYQGLDSAQSFDLRKTLHDSGVRDERGAQPARHPDPRPLGGEAERLPGVFPGAVRDRVRQRRGAHRLEAILQWKKKNKDLLAIKGGGHGGRGDPLLDAWRASPGSPIARSSSPRWRVGSRPPCPGWRSRPGTLWRGWPTPSRRGGRSWRRPREAAPPPSRPPRRRWRERPDRAGERDEGTKDRIDGRPRGCAAPAT